MARLNVSLMLVIVFVWGILVQSQPSPGDILLPNQQITDSQTLISAQGTFELGFFSLANKTSRYLGIWYRNMKTQTLVWVANRETPITSPNGVLKLTTDATLTLQDGSQMIWFTGSTSTKNVQARLLDSGNFVLTDNSTGRLVWQSFDVLCDTLLPGMRLGYDLQINHYSYITSWKSPSDPSAGDSTYRLEPKRLPELLLYKGNVLKFRAGSWNGERFDGIPAMKQINTLIYHIDVGPNNTFFSYEAPNGSVMWRLVVGDDGLVHRWYNSSGEWLEYWHLPQDNCGYYKYCGEYGICTNNDCACLTGYTPKSQTSWGLRNFTDGCVRNEPLNCTKENGFIQLSNMKLPDTEYATWESGKNVEDCKSSCLKSCSCMAYAFIDGKCVLWQGPLVDSVQFGDQGDVLYLRNGTVSYSGKGPDGNNTPVGKIVGASVAGVILLGVLIGAAYYFFPVRQREGYSGENGRGDQDIHDAGGDQDIHDVGEIGRGDQDIHAEGENGRGDQDLHAEGEQREPPVVPPVAPVGVTAPRDTD